MNEWAAIRCTTGHVKFERPPLSDTALFFSSSYPGLIAESLSRTTACPCSGRFSWPVSLFPTLRRRLRSRTPWERSLSFLTCSRLRSRRICVASTSSPLRTGVSRSVSRRVVPRTQSQGSCGGLIQRPGGLRRGWCRRRLMEAIGRRHTPRRVVHGLYLSEEAAWLTAGSKSL